ncbi:MAG: TonB-dependent receptor [Thermoanaerobaculia bacterium]|nr:TonB-dependent receptor [Thermoanaerobaculia bacterium]
MFTSAQTRTRSLRSLVSSGLLAASLTGALLVALPCGAEPCNLEIQVVGPLDRAVTDAQVRFLSSNEEVYTTDAEGRICIASLAAGRHVAIVVAEGFAVLDAIFDVGGDVGDEFRVQLAPAFGEELVVTGTRVAQKLLDSPVHVQQVDRQAIEAAAARTLADAVELTPGVRIESNCQNCNFSQVRMLGLEGPYSQILIDGQPMVSSLAMVYGIEQFPARMLDTVEVVKGGGAAIYGAGAVGGVINLIPHAPLDTHVTLDGRFLETGNEPGHSLSALIDWSPRNGRAGLSLLAQDDRVEPSDRDHDGFTEITSRDLTTFALRGEGYVLSDAARLTAEVNYTDAYRRGGDLAGIDLLPEETALTEEIDTQRLAFGTSWLHTVSSKLDYRLAASWADTDRGSYYGAGFDPAAYGRTDDPLWLVDGQLNLYRDGVTTSAGLSHSHEDLSDSQPGYGRELAETQEETGLFLQEDRSLGQRASVVYGLRVDRHSALDDPVVSPRMAWMISPRPSLTFRVSFAEGFRAPEIFDEDLHIELAGGDARVVSRAPGLVEETSRAWLASAEWRPTFSWNGGVRKGSASLEAALFRTDLENLFDVVEADDPATPNRREFLRVNAQGARVEGVELSASVRWGSRWTAQLGYVVQSSRFETAEPDFGSLRFFRSPDEHGTLNLQVALPGELNLFFGGRYTGSMIAPHYAGFIDEDRLERTQTFLELDLNLSRTFEVAGHQLTVTAGVKNLTDEYQPDLDRGPDRDSNYVYGPRLPRTAHFGLRWDL